MKYAGIVDNDVADSTTGMCVSFWTQGCPHRCPGCHNPETWSFDGGMDLPDNYLDILYEKLTANGILRDLSILGGEPLCEENKHLVYETIKAVKQKFPEIKINLWTGYLLEDLLSRKDTEMDFILANVYVLIDGPYIEAQRDIRLTMRGSSNQRMFSETDLKKALLLKSVASKTSSKLTKEYEKS